MIESLLALDQKLFLMMNSWHAEWLNPFMSFISGQAIWTPFILFILFMAYKQLSRRSFYIFLLFLLLILIASDVTSSYLLKNIFNRMRPCRLEELKPIIYKFGQKCGGKFGFVSSHAANSLTILVFSFSVLKFKPYMHVLWILPVLVSYSRIYLGVHYPGDILGGMFVGLFWGLLLAFFFKNQSRSETA